MVNNQSGSFSRPEFTKPVSGAQPVNTSTSNIDSPITTATDSFERATNTNLKLTTQPPAEWLNPQSPYYQDFTKALSVPYVLTQDLLKDNGNNLEFYQKGPIRIGHVPSDPTRYYSSSSTVRTGEYFDNLQALALKHREVQHDRTGIIPDLITPDISYAPSYRAREAVRNGDTEAIRKALRELLEERKIIKIPHGAPSPLPQTWALTSETRSFPPELSADIFLGRAESRVLTKAKIDQHLSEDFCKEGPIRVYNHILFLKDGEKTPSVGTRAGNYFQNLQQFALRFREMQCLKTPPLHEQGYKLLGQKTTPEKQVDSIKNWDLNAIKESLHEMIDKRIEFHFPAKL